MRRSQPASPTQGDWVSRSVVPIRGRAQAPHVISHRPDGRIAVQRLVVRCVARLRISKHHSFSRRNTYCATTLDGGVGRRGTRPAKRKESLRVWSIPPPVWTCLAVLCLYSGTPREWTWSADGQPSLAGDGRNQPNGDES
jgi:hypothetical protein